MMAGSAFVFTPARVFDGEETHVDQTVVVSGNLITGMGPRRLTEIPPGATKVDCADRTLLPGFIDLHVHIGLVDPRSVLLGGVTTVRDLGWPLDRIIPLSHELAGRVTAGPRVHFAGPMLTAPRGYPSEAAWAPPGTAREVSSPEEARAVVRDLAARGASIIKVAQDPRAGAMLQLKLLETIVREAHAAGRAVASHAAGIAAVEAALEAGINELAHGLWSDEALPSTLTHRLVRSSTAVIPTIAVAPTPARMQNLTEFVAGGGRVLYGTDMGNQPTVAGINLEELDLMVKAGMTPAQVLGSATADAARQMRLQGRGRVQRGAFADLLLVEGDPTIDVSAMGRLVMVMREGVPVH